MATLAILGGVGGLLGATGSIIQGIEQKRQAKRFRRRQRAAINQAFEQGALIASQITGRPVVGGPGPRMSGGLTLEGLSRPGGQPFLGASPGQTPLFQLGEQFLRGTFQDPTSSPLVQNITKGLRAAQAVRGTLGGGAGVSAEALGTGFGAAQLQQSLLPSLLQFALFPEQVRQQVVGFEAPLRAAAATGAPIAGIGQPSFLPSIAGNALQQGVAGLLGGVQLGQAFNFGGSGGGGSIRQRRLAAQSDPRQQFNPFAGVLGGLG